MFCYLNSRHRFAIWFTRMEETKKEHEIHAMMRPLISCDLKVREKWMKWQKLHENGLSFFQNQYYCRLWKWVKRQWNCCQLFILLKKSTNIFTCQIFAIFRDNGDISASFSSHALGHFCTFSLLSLLWTSIYLWRWDTSATEKIFWNV